MPLGFNLLKYGVYLMNKLFIVFIFCVFTNGATAAIRTAAAARALAGYFFIDYTAYNRGNGNAYKNYYRYIECACRRY